MAALHSHPLPRSPSPRVSAAPTTRPRPRSAPHPYIFSARQRLTDRLVRSSRRRPGAHLPPPRLSHPSLPSRRRTTAASVRPSWRPSLGRAVSAVGSPRGFPLPLRRPRRLRRNPRRLPWLQRNLRPTPGLTPTRLRPRSTRKRRRRSKIPRTARRLPPSASSHRHLSRAFLVAAEGAVAAPTGLPTTAASQRRRASYAYYPAQIPTCAPPLGVRAPSPTDHFRQHAGNIVQSSCLINPSNFLTCLGSNPRIYLSI